MRSSIKLQILGYRVEAQEQLTLGDLLEQVSGKDYLELHVGVKTGKDEHSPTLKIFCKKKISYLPTHKI